MFHTAQADMASSTAPTRAIDAHHRALLTVVLTGEETDASTAEPSTVVAGASDRTRIDEN